MQDITKKLLIQVRSESLLTVAVKKPSRKYNLCTTYCFEVYEGKFTGWEAFDLRTEGPVMH